MKILSAYDLRVPGLPDYEGVHWYDCGADPKHKHLDDALTELHAKTVLDVNLNGKEIDVFLDASGRPVAAVMSRKLVGREWLAALERKFGAEFSEFLQTVAPRA
jgi:hypothetical protein